MRCLRKQTRSGGLCAHGEAVTGIETVWAGKHATPLSLTGGTINTMICDKVRARQKRASRD